jgi:hypothetical protein
LEITCIRVFCAVNPVLAIQSEASIIIILY